MKKLINIENKTKISTITLILILTTSAILFALPLVNAQGTRQTYAFLGASPNPVGVNQEVLLHVGITDMLASVEWGWTGITVTVTKPNNEIMELGPYTTDPTGGTGAVFTPDMVGTYTLQSHFPEQPMIAGTREIPAGTTMLASDSPEVTLVVQNDPIQFYPGHNLPTEYWSRPITSEFRNWYWISGNWLEGKAAGSVTEIIPYMQNAPETAHILWAKELANGGLVGGTTGIHGYTTGDAYQGEFANSVIINGVLYYNRYHTGFTSNMPQQGIRAVDLRTGEELWFRNNTRLSFGQTFYFNGYNQHGAYAYLWEVSGTTYNAIDAFSGEWVYTMNGVPRGTRIFGPDGEILIYTVNQNAGWMTLWNSTKLGIYGQNPYAGTGSWGAEGKTYDDPSIGYQWNVSIPTGLPGSVRKVFFGDRIIGSTAGTGTGTPMADNPVVNWALDLTPNNEGNLLFNESWTPPVPDTNVKIGAFDTDTRVFTLWIKELRTHYGFSMDTGDLLWGPTEPQSYQDSFLWGDWHFTAAYGNYYSAATSGILYAYDMETGDLLWTYDAIAPYNEPLWIPRWQLYTAFITDGKIYLYHTEHSTIDPKPRGAPFICINATSGAEIFNMPGFRGTYWGGTALMGDGIIAFHNTYDQRVYAIGRGPTQTTVSVKTNVISQGSSVLIDGTIMDISYGTNDYALTARFPNGVPAVADESMSKWMQYVYLQYERPTDIEGVQVFLKILDPNGDYYSATVTTDENGRFSHMWAPSIVGEYKVTAMFEGSKAYYPSQETTTFGVDTTPEYPQPPTVEEIAAESASRTIAMLPPYPDVPTQEQIAADAASRTIAMLPPYPQPTQCPEIPAYQTLDLIIIALVVVAIIIGIYIIIKKK